MTLYLNLSSLAWAALTALFVARYARQFSAALDRLMTVLEARHNVAPAIEAETEPIPDDLLGYVNAIRTGNAEFDGMMREQTLAVLYEQYATLGDWDKVRAWSATNLQTDTRADGWGNN